MFRSIKTTMICGAWGVVGTVLLLGVCFFAGRYRSQYSWAAFRAWAHACAACERASSFPAWRGFRVVQRWQQSCASGVERTGRLVCGVFAPGVCLLACAPAAARDLTATRQRLRVPSPTTTGPFCDGPGRRAYDVPPGNGGRGHAIRRSAGRHPGSARQRLVGLAASGPRPVLGLSVWT